MILFFYRYLSDMAAMLAQMQQSMWLRGFRGNRLSSLPAYAALMGSLLLRSYAQSERVYLAMRLRGYGAGPRPRGQFRATGDDRAALALALMGAAGLAAATWWL